MCFIKREASRVINATGNPLAAWRAFRTEVFIN
jgi:hypothetical protein